MAIIPQKKSVARPAPPFSWNILKNLVHLSGLTGVELLQWIHKYWFKLSGQIMMIAAIALVIALGFNAVGWRGVNGWIGLTFVAIGTLTLLTPTAVTGSALAIDALDLTREGDARSLKAYVRGVAHVMMFVGLVFLFLSIVPVYNFTAVGIILLALLLFGYWSLAYMVATGIYAKTAMGIIVVALVLASFKAFTWVSPQAKAIESAIVGTSSALNKTEANRLEELQDFRAERGLTAAEQLEWNRLTAKEAGRGFFASTRERLETLGEEVKKDVRVTSLRPVIITGLDDLPDGCYTFKTEGPLVYIGDEPWRLEANARLNGERPGNRICMDMASPPVLSFVEGTPASMPMPQTITFSFTWAP